MTLPRLPNLHGTSKLRGETNLGLGDPELCGLAALDELGELGVPAVGRGFVEADGLREDVAPNSLHPLAMFQQFLG